MKKITSLKTLSLLISLFCAVGFGYGQSIFDNPITGTNPNTNDPYIIGQTVNANIIVSGIGRGIGISGTNAINRYNANGWNTVSLDNTAYFYFTITPNTGYQISFVSFVYNGQASGTGPTSFAFRSSLDGFVSDIGTPTASGATINLSATLFQNVTTPITFRIYGWGASGGSGTFSINDFTFNGSVSAIPCFISTTWNGTTWSAGTPDINKNAIIAANYNTTTNSSFSACSLTVNAGFDLRVTNGHYVEVENDVVVNGNIIVDNHGAFKQNSNTSTYTHGLGGTSVVRKETSILNNWYDYTYWCSPISGLTIGTSPLTDSTMRHWFDASKYEDILAETGNSGVFSTGHDDIDDNGDDWTFAYDSFPMNPGVGFAATHSQTGYSGARQYTYEFYGIFNNGPLSASIFYNGANGDKDWNLIGNPYPCALDFNAFYAANSGVVEGAAYLWSHRTAIDPNASGNEAFNFSQNDYAIITAGSGSINNSDNGDGIVPNDYIPSGQGFFISGLAIGVVNFDNSMRMADATSNNQFFKSTNNKSKSNDVANKIWVNLTSDNGVFNQVLVAYVDGATNDNDGMAYDATRMLSSGASSIIYTLIGDDNTNKFAIQGKAVNSLGPDETIKLGFYTSISSATLYKFTLAHIQGDFLNNHAIFLKDHLLNKVHCLSTSDYSFTSEVGEFNNRFEIAFSNQALSVEDALLNKNALTIVQLENDEVQFTATNNLNIKNVAIFDLLGRQLYQFTGNSNQETYKLSNLHNSVFVAKVTLSNGGVITKKAFKK